MTGIRTTPERNRNISLTTVNGLRFALTILSALSKDLNDDVTFATVSTRCHKQSIPSFGRMQSVFVGTLFRNSSTIES